MYRTGGEPCGFRCLLPLSGHGLGLGAISNSTTLVLLPTMNGVRRLLGGAVSSSPPSNQDSPLSAQTVSLAFSPKAGPTWPPSSPSTSQQSYGSPSASPNTTAALFLKKDRPKPPAINDDDANRTYPIAGRQSMGITSNSQINPIPSPARSQTMPNSPPSGHSSFSGRGTPPSSYSTRNSTRKSGITDPDWKRLSGNLNTRDELLVSLMASEAVIDSRDFEILTAEEVEDLKKVLPVLISYVLTNSNYDRIRNNKSSTPDSRQ